MYKALLEAEVARELFDEATWQALPSNPKQEAVDQPVVTPDLNPAPCESVPDVARL